jgi:hypothetical protein
MDQNLELINMLLARLERLSADSYWAHQASGIRGSLLKWVEFKEMGVAALIARGFDVLEKAAKER